VKKLLISLLFILLCLAPSQAQQKYWIYLKDKTDKIKPHVSITEAPISARYLDSLVQLGIKPVTKSKWLNAVSANLNQEQFNRVNELRFVREIQELNGRFKVTSIETYQIYTLAKVLEQINADTLISLGLSGKGVKIGIIDAGFLNANIDSYLKDIIENDQISGYKNFIETDLTDPYGGDQTNNDRHGTKVFRAIAGRDNESYAGLATNAQFYLARTDQEQREYHDEEDYWVAAMEWMYDEGVQLINSSLGYSDGFDNPEENYEPRHIDGSHSAITRAVNIAVKEKGMTIVLAAGNDGNNKFKVISIPSDANGIISVGASGYRHWNKLDYSSIGPEHLEPVKPEIVCFATDGTSFSAPVITGLVACMLEYKPELKNNEILEIIKKSSHLYPYPNNYLGYGVPNGNKIITLLNNPNAVINHSKEIQGQVNSGYSIILPKNDNIMAFHKKNKTIVLEQEKLRWKDGGIIVTPLLGAEYTTVATESMVWEIHWIK
jgi:subtilisin family serine protease